MSTDNQPMTAVVEFEIQTETTSLDEWLDEWQKRAEDAYEHEPETTAYEAAVGVEDESRVLVFERYANGYAGLQTHMERPAHKAIGDAMGARRMNKRRPYVNVGFDMPDYGWWARKDFASPARAAGYPLILLCMRFAESTHRDRFIELSGEHARYCQTAEPDTLIYSGAVAADEFEPDSTLAKGDLFFVMACTDDAAMEKHAMDPNHLALGGKLAAAGVETASVEAFQYRTSGRGFLWR